MNERQTILVLSDEDPELGHILNKLRQEGWRVILTAHSYEAVLIMARQSITCLLARVAFVPDAAFLDQINRFQFRPYLALSSEWPLDAEYMDHADTWVQEPFSYEELAETLEHSRESTQSSPQDEARGTSPGHRAGKPQKIVHQLLTACRTISELERDREQLLTNALEFLMEVSGSGRGSLMLQDAEGSTIRMVRRQGFPQSAPSPLVVNLGDGLAGTVASRGEPLLIAADSRVVDPLHRGYQSGSFLIVPLKNRRRTLGVVNLTNRLDGQTYTQEDLVHVQMLADHIAVALANSDAYSELHEMTVIDPLTHLYNRRHFDREIKKEIERARRYGRKLTLALLDIDNFKLFDDINGYATGDAIIRHVAEIIQDCFREVDVVTRWGGDEFAVLLPDTTSPGKLPASSHNNFIERVRKAVEDSDFRDEIPSNSGRITLSVGVATYPTDCRTEEELFAEANTALHRAKRMGNNRTCYARDNGRFAKEDEQDQGEQEANTEE